MSNDASRRGAVAALLATLVLWAYSWVVMKQALAYAGPFDFAALRYLLGAGVLFLALAATRQRIAPPPLAATALIGLCQTAAFQGLEQWALVDGGAGHVALLAYTMPFWAVLLACSATHSATWSSITRFCSPDISWGSELYSSMTCSGSS